MEATTQDYLTPSQETMLLPHDILASITSFCALQTLQTLTRVDKDFQALAEKLIYTSVDIRTYNQKEGAMRALATSPIRAGYVRTFRIDYHCPDPGLVDDLVRALGGMKNLRDLRVRLGSAIGVESVEALNDVLCTSPHPHLNVLFLDSHLNLGKITSTHKSLAFLGVYAAAGRPNAGSLSSLSSLPSISNQNRSLLTAAFSTSGNIRGYGCVTLIPNFLNSEQTHTLHTQLIPRYLRTETSPGSDPERVTTVVLFIQTVPPGEAFHAFARSMRETFPNTCEVELNLGCGLLARKDWIEDAVDVLPGTRVQVWNWDPCSDGSGDCGQVFRGSKARFARWLRE